MPNEPRIQSRDIPFTCAEPQYRDAQEASPRAVLISTMTTGGFTAALVTTAHTGCYAIPQDGNARGQVRQIKSVTGTVATVDAVWASTASVTTIALWTPPDVPVRCTSAGTTSTAVSTTHASITNEADSYWNSKGYFLLGRNSTFAGSIYPETGFTSSTGTFTASGGFGATPGVGALFDLRKLIRSEGPVNATVNQKTLTRREVAFKEAGSAVPITAEGTVEFVSAIRPLTATAPQGVAATPPQDLRDYLGDMFTETLDTGSTTNGASSSGFTVASTASTHAVGGFVLFTTGDGCQVLTDNGAGVYTNGTGQIASSSVVTTSNAYASAWYKPKTTDFRTRTFDIYKGRLRREVYHGCMPTLEIKITRDQVVTFNWKYTAAVALEYETGNPITSTTYPLTLLDTTIPVDGKGARLILDGTQVLVADMTINTGLTPLPRPSITGLNQMDGMAMETVPTTVTFTAYADVNDIASFKALGERMRSRDVINMLYQKGRSAGETFMIGMPSLQLTKSNFTYQNGQGELQCEGVVQIPTLSGLGTTVPGFAFGFC